MPLRASAARSCSSIRATPPPAALRQLDARISAQRPLEILFYGVGAVEGGKNSRSVTASCSRCCASSGLRTSREAQLVHGLAGCLNYYAALARAARAAAVSDRRRRLQSGSREPIRSG